MNINDKVICIDDNFNNGPDPRKFFNKIPIKNQIYVIRGIERAKNGEIGIQLVGIYSEPDGVFYPWRFVTLEEMKLKNKDNFASVVKQANTMDLKSIGTKNSMSVRF